MSARVLNPFSLFTEMRRVQSSKRRLDAEETTGDVVGVKRCLFGPVDHDQAVRTSRRELEEMTERSSHKYNFDFQLGQPQEGRYKWEAVPSAEVHQSYALRRMHFGGAAASQGGDDVTQTTLHLGGAGTSKDGDKEADTSQASQASQASDYSLPPAGCLRKRTPAQIPTRQAQMTEFLVQKKKRASNKQ